MRDHFSRNAIYLKTNDIIILHSHPLFADARQNSLPLLPPSSFPYKSAETFRTPLAHPTEIPQPSAEQSNRLCVYSARACTVLTISMHAFYLRDMRVYSSPCCSMYGKSARILLAVVTRPCDPDTQDTRVGIIR